MKQAACYQRLTSKNFLEVNKNNVTEEKILRVSHPRINTHCKRRASIRTTKAFPKSVAALPDEDFPSAQKLSRQLITTPKQFNITQ